MTKPIKHASFHTTCFMSAVIYVLLAEPLRINSHPITDISISDGAVAFDEVSATIEIQDENNNPPAFIQSQFIGGM